jgi:L-ribulose-5-phosphate 4-epimerase
MVIVDLKTGKIVEGSLSPSSDTPTHLEIYKAFKNVSTVVHTHSQWATILSQNMCSIDCAGTTHADYFYGTIPCTRNLTRNEIINDYEFNTGRLIVSTFQNKKINYENIPAVLVSHHGPFV